jgi:hypothetical protein
MVPIFGNTKGSFMVNDVILRIDVTKIVVVSFVGI